MSNTFSTSASRIHPSYVNSLESRTSVDTSTKPAIPSPYLCTTATRGNTPPNARTSSTTPPPSRTVVSSFPVLVATKPSITLSHPRASPPSSTTAYPVSLPSILWSSTAPRPMARGTRPRPCPMQLPKSTRSRSSSCTSPSPTLPRSPPSCWTHPAARSIRHQLVWICRGGASLMGYAGWSYETRTRISSRS
ncbi:hypothetical protein C8J57DRAFT_1273274 [Mycena rebaudengoi]|nr:hypothetical protein C8J57DRAFT_1273274 [Mycena rebaudengoi]